MFTERILRTRSGATARASGRVGSRLARSGLLQALAAPHGVERYVELLAPSFSLREGRAEVVSVRRSAGSVTLGLRANDRWRGFLAGQFAPVTVEVDGVRRTRCYSPAGSQHAAGGELELTVRRHEDGLVSRHLHDTARPGMVLGLGEPAGEFVLPDPRPQRLVLISGGSGITPVMSMLRTLCEEGHGCPVAFLHFARTPADVVYDRELERLCAAHRNVSMRVVYTREPPGGHRGHLSRAHLRALDEAHADADVYVCGPPGLVATTRRLWSDARQPQRVHVESFLPPSPPPTARESRSSVRFLASEIEVTDDGATLLEQAERAGLSPAHGCRMGICHTCTTCKRAGRVRDVRSGELSGSGSDAIQLCVSVAAGDVELEL